MKAEYTYHMFDACNDLQNVSDTFQNEASAIVEAKEWLMGYGGDGSYTTIVKNETVATITLVTTKKTKVERA